MIILVIDKKDVTPWHDLVSANYLQQNTITLLVSSLFQGITQDYSEKI